MPRKLTFFIWNIFFSFRRESGEKIVFLHNLNVILKIFN